MSGHLIHPVSLTLRDARFQCHQGSTRSISCGTRNISQTTPNVFSKSGGNLSTILYVFVASIQITNLRCLVRLCD